MSRLRAKTLVPDRAREIAAMDRPLLRLFSPREQLDALQREFAKPTLTDSLAEIDARIERHALQIFRGGAWLQLNTQERAMAWQERRPV